MALNPSLLPPTGVKVLMPSQPSMPPLSSTQLQIDTALQEFQLVDLSRRFLVHDSFWALPEQFLGNKVRGPAAPWIRRGRSPSSQAQNLPGPASLLLTLVGSREDSAVGQGAVPQHGPWGQQLFILPAPLKMGGMPADSAFRKPSWATSTAGLKGGPLLGSPWASSA